MVAAMRDVDYATRRNGESSIGAHIRHNLDFITALLCGVAGGRIDYNVRQRDPRIESDRVYAIEQMMSACERLRNLTSWRLASPVIVRSEVNERVWHTSSVSREIEFLHSHTVHHYALVKWLLNEASESVGASFGVSPSTLRFRSGVSLAS